MKDGNEMVEKRRPWRRKGKESRRQVCTAFDLDRVNLARHESCHRFYDKISLGTVWRRGKLTEDISYRLSRSSHRISLFSVCGFASLSPSSPSQLSSSIAFSLIIKLKDVAGDVVARSGTFKTADPKKLEIVKFAS